MKWPRLRRKNEPRTYRTKSGRVLTDSDIEALADEAERGYDVEHLKGRPSRPIGPGRHGALR